MREGSSEKGGFSIMADESGINERLTALVIISCIVAASGGLIFGYDIGISGGLPMMIPFLEKFFPAVLSKMRDTKQNQYCIYDSQILTAFTSSLYIAGFASSLMAGHVTKSVGRQNTILIGGLAFLIGSIFNAAAITVVMLILGRILLGLGVGLTNQSIPLYLSEVSPAKYRGAFLTGFQLFIGLGVVTSNLINFGAARLPTNGWRLSLGFGIVPSLVMTLGTLFIPDTPSSLIQRGKIQQARLTLRRIRGPCADVEAELDNLLHEDTMVRNFAENPFKAILRRRYRPQFVMAIAIPVFQQLTGVNIVAFYAPILFQTVGSQANAALLGAVILGLVNLLSVLVSTSLVDRIGRRILFIQGGIQMLFCQVVETYILGSQLGDSGEIPLDKTYSLIVLVSMCLYAAGFGWSWGPLSWIIPSEIYPMEIRAAGMSITIAMNFFTTFVLAQGFLSMLCHLKYGTFMFYGAWIFIMTVFIAAFLPETKGIHLDSMNTIWEQHWYWKRFVKE
ncbi:sugar transport protein 5-like [Tasmannia lanceolata]|uniref:sugar transport protein 5-like n=1 Tax=Tasmannia lanceolata TaxID=3420 RepID=UPI0040643D75